MLALWEDSMQFVFQGEIRVRMKAASLERHHVSDFRLGLDRESAEFPVSAHRCGLSIWALLGGSRARILPGRYVSLPEIAFFTQLRASLNTVEALLGML